MKSKKILMLALLIVFIIVIIALFINVNNTALEKIANDPQNNINANTIDETAEVTNNSGTVRKSTEKVEANTSNMIEIKDNYFIQQTNDVYINLQDYIGKTIKMEGLIYSYQDSNGDTCYAVVRNTPGCCGSDGLAGLDIRYDGEYPEEDTWVEIVGVIGEDTVFENTVPAIQITSLKETEKGTAFVTN